MSAYRPSGKGASIISVVPSRSRGIDEIPHDLNEESTTVKDSVVYQDPYAPKRAIVKEAPVSETTSVTRRSKDRPVKQKAEKEPKVPRTKPPKPEKPSFEDGLPAWVIDQKPKYGFSLFMWHLYTRFGLYKHSWMEPPLKVGPLELGQEIVWHEKAINAFGASVFMIMGIFAKKGGVGKTTTATWAASTFGATSELATAVFDGDRGGGLVAARFGSNESEAMTINELVSMVENNEPIGYKVLAERTVTDRETGVVIFHSPSNEGISREQMQTVGAELEKHFGFLVADTPPGLEVDQSIGIADLSNIRVVVGDGPTEEGIELGVVKTLDYEPYGLREHIDQVIVLIVDLPARQCNARLAHNIAARCGVRPDQVLFIPYERYLDKRVKTNTKRVSQHAVSMRTRLAFRELVYKACVMVKQAQETQSAPAVADPGFENASH